MGLGVGWGWGVWGGDGGGGGGLWGWGVSGTQVRCFAGLALGKQALACRLRHGRKGAAADQQNTIGRLLAATPASAASSPPLKKLLTCPQPPAPAPAPPLGKLLLTCPRPPLRPSAPGPALHIRWAAAVGSGVPLTLATGFLLCAAMAARRGKASTGGAIS